jgi:parallel beta-helix repeat protein
MVGGMLLLLALSVFVTPIYAQPPCPSSITTNTKLSADCTGSITISANTITLDCQGHTVSGIDGIYSGDNGIVLIGRTGVTIKNCKVTNFAAAFQLISSDDNTLIWNTANGNFLGFQLVSSDGNVLTGNTANRNTLFLSGGCGGGFFISGINNVLDGNTANGNKVCTVSPYFNFGFIVEGNGNTLNWNSASGNGGGFLLSGFGDNTLNMNMANANTYYGFGLFSSSSNTLSRNLACGNTPFDAFQDAFSTGNSFHKNLFCTTSGI